MFWLITWLVVALLCVAVSMVYFGYTDGVNDGNYRFYDDSKAIVIVFSLCWPLVLVFFLCVGPFFILYWLSKQIGEKKRTQVDMKKKEQREREIALVEFALLKKKRSKR